MYAHHSPPARLLAHPTAQDAYVISVGSLEIDLWKGCVRLSGMRLPLSTTEYRVLLYLALHTGRTVSVEELLQNVWGCDHATGGTAGQVKSCIRRLREHIEVDTRHPKYILAVYGSGYLMPADLDGY